MVVYPMPLSNQMESRIVRKIEIRKLKKNKTKLTKWGWGWGVYVYCGLPNALSNQIESRVLVSKIEMLKKNKTKLTKSRGVGGGGSVDLVVCPMPLSNQMANIQRKYRIENNKILH